jgi:predicted DNA-binding transcriptional regulator AlpA
MSHSSAPAAHGQLPEHGYVRISQLIPAVFPVSRATFLRRVKDGAATGFPQPIKVGRCVFFRAEDVRAFIASHGAAHA